MDFKYFYTGQKVLPEHRDIAISEELRLPNPRNTEDISNATFPKTQSYRVTPAGYYVKLYRPLFADPDSSEHLEERQFLVKGAQRRFFRIIQQYVDANIHEEDFNLSNEDITTEIKWLKQERRFEKRIDPSQTSQSGLRLLALRVVQLSRACEKDIGAEDMGQEPEEATRIFLKIQEMKVEKYLRVSEKCFLRSEDLDELIWEAISEIPKAAAAPLEKSIYTNRARKIGDACKLIDKIADTMITMANTERSDLPLIYLEFLDSVHPQTNFVQMIERQRVFCKKIASIRGVGSDGNKDAEYYRISHIESEQREHYLSALNRLSAEADPKLRLMAGNIEQLYKGAILLMRETADVRRPLRSTTTAFFSGCQKFTETAGLHVPSFIKNSAKGVMAIG